MSELTPAKRWSFVHTDIGGAMTTVRQHVREGRDRDRLVTLLHEALGIAFRNWHQAREAKSEANPIDRGGLFLKDTEEVPP